MPSVASEVRRIVSSSSSKRATGARLLAAPTMTARRSRPCSRAMFRTAAPKNEPKAGQLEQNRAPCSVAARRMTANCEPRDPAANAETETAPDASSFGRAATDTQASAEAEALIETANAAIDTSSKRSPPTRPLFRPDGRSRRAAAGRCASCRRDRDRRGAGGDRPSRRGHSDHRPGRRNRSARGSQSRAANRAGRNRHARRAAGRSEAADRKRPQAKSLPKTNRQTAK